MVKTIINDPSNHHNKYRWYKPFPNGWFIFCFNHIVLHLIPQNILLHLGLGVKKVVASHRAAREAAETGRVACLLRVKVWNDN